MKRVAMVGSRNWADDSLIHEYIQRLDRDDIVVSGGARGVDSIAERYARERGLEVRVFLADWDKYGKSAGIMRNADIVNNADIVWAFWDGRSSGTRNTIERALKAPHIQQVIVVKRSKAK